MTYYRFSYEYDSSSVGNTLGRLPDAIAETVDRALRKDFGGYVRGSLTYEIVPSPRELARARQAEIQAGLAGADAEAFWFAPAPTPNKET